MLNETSLGMSPKIQGVTGLADILSFRAASHGQKEAIIYGDQRITFNKLHGRAKAIAHELKGLALAPGDKVGLLLPNSPEFVAAFFGIIGSGCTVVPINPLLKADEIAHVLTDSDAKVLIVHENLLATIADACRRTPELQTILIVPATTMGTVKTPQLPVRTLELDPLKTIDNFAWAPISNVHTDIALIVYTSGTTGKPKGAMLSHHNLLSIFPARLDLFDMNEHDCCLSTLPLCHIYGMTVVMIGTIAKAARLVIMPKFEAPAALKLVESEGVTILPAVPAMYQFMLAELAQNSYDLSSLRLCFSGAAPLASETRILIESFFGVPVIEGYALTETACVATLNPLRGERKTGSVGPAVPGVQMAIVGNNGYLLPPGPENIGEIAVLGPNVMLGYYKQPQSTAEVLRGGWFLTGDLGYADADGYIYIAGRKKELIIRGGANIYPREVEDVILQIPGVREVAVIGVPDERMGERVKAIVVAQDASINEELVKAHCTQHLADFKVPRIVEFTSALPRNSTGKILKRLLK